jgi:hypothetical protein
LSAADGKRRREEEERQQRMDIKRQRIKEQKNVPEAIIQANKYADTTMSESSDSVVTNLLSLLW